MNILDLARERVGNTLRQHSIHKHRSRIGWRDAPRYSRYLVHAQNAYDGPLPQLEPGVATALEVFRTDGATSFATPATAAIAGTMFDRLTAREAAGENLWPGDDQERGQHNYVGEVWRDFPEVEGLFRGDLGAFLQNYFAANFKILHGVLYRSVGRPDARVGSQRWHSDSGPGICINVMFYLHDTVPADGTLQTLPWSVARAIYDREPTEVRRRARQHPGTDRRTLMADYYDEFVDRDFAHQVACPAGPAGLVVPFLNNTLHRGGYPAPGRSRTAIVFHCYPSHLPTDFARYARDGIAKTVPYPKDPAAAF